MLEIHSTVMDPLIGSDMIDSIQIVCRLVSCWNNKTWSGQGSGLQLQIQITATLLHRYDSAPSNN